MSRFIFFLVCLLGACDPQPARATPQTPLPTADPASADGQMHLETSQSVSP
jgi:hypothetical protein